MQNHRVKVISLLFGYKGIYVSTVHVQEAPGTFSLSEADKNLVFDQPGKYNGSMIFEWNKTKYFFRL